MTLGVGIPFKDMVVSGGCGCVGGMALELWM